MRATRFETEVMRSRGVVIGAAVAAIAVGVMTFVLGLRQPTAVQAGLHDTIELHTR